MKEERGERGEGKRKRRGKKTKKKKRCGNTYVRVRVLKVA